jgi:arylsulfatase A-like enzyme
MVNRRKFIAGAAATAGSIACTGKAAAAAPQPKTARKPNLIYVFADQLRWSSCGFNGDSFARTPNMDRFATQSVNLNQAISSTCVCAPYRASLMTGKYQSGTGMVINEMRLSPEHHTFGGALKDAGYRTAYIGKWHMWANQGGHHELVRNGFTPPGKYRLGFDNYWAAYNFNHIYFHSPYFLDDATPHIRTDYEPDGQTNMAIDYLKKEATKQDAGKEAEPFALFLSWGPPHYPWGLDNVEEQYADMFRNVTLPTPPNYTTVQDPYADENQQLPKNYDTIVKEWRQVYYAQTANLDWNLGRLMKTVDDLGLADDTIFVFTCDHGEMFGAHGRQSKLIFYEEAARVPFLIRWPRHIAANSKSDVLLGTPDIMPTVLGMMDVRCPTDIEGHNLANQIVHNTGTMPEIAHMQGMGHTFEWRDGHEWRATRDHEYTYAIYHVDGKELLFHNTKDPWQMHNLADDKASAATLKHYRDTSTAFRKEHNDEFHECTWYESRWTVDRNITNTATGTKQDLAELKELTDKWFPNGIGDKSVKSGPHPMG